MGQELKDDKELFIAARSMLQNKADNQFTALNAHQRQNVHDSKLLYLIVICLTIVVVTAIVGKNNSMIQGNHNRIFGATPLISTPEQDLPWLYEQEKDV